MKQEGERELWELTGLHFFPAPSSVKCSGWEEPLHWWLTEPADSSTFTTQVTYLASKSTFHLASNIRVNFCIKTFCATEDKSLV